jgi:hypothetical protein
MFDNVGKCWAILIKIFKTTKVKQNKIGNRASRLCAPPLKNVEVHMAFSRVIFSKNVCRGK